MVTYFNNMMGPARTDWYRERGLTRRVTKILTEGREFYPEGLGPGDVWEYDEITTYYCAGRIDIRDSEKEGYDGWDEYSIGPMHGEDWNALGDWFMRLKTEEQWSYEKLISTFEEEVLGRSIRWWKEEE